MKGKVSCLLHISNHILINWLRGQHFKHVSFNFHRSCSVDISQYLYWVGGHKRRLGIWGTEAGSRGRAPVGGLGHEVPQKLKLFYESTHNICIKIQQTTRQDCYNAQILFFFIEKKQTNYIFQTTLMQCMGIGHRDLGQPQSSTTEKNYY